MIAILIVIPKIKGHKLTAVGRRPSPARHEAAGEQGERLRGGRQADGSDARRHHHRVVQLYDGDVVEPLRRRHRAVRRVDGDARHRQPHDVRHVGARHRSDAHLEVVQREPQVGRAVAQEAVGGAEHVARRDEHGTAHEPAAVVQARHPGPGAGRGQRAADHVRPVGAGATHAARWRRNTQRARSRQTATKRGEVKVGPVLRGRWK